MWVSGRDAIGIVTVLGFITAFMLGLGIAVALSLVLTAMAVLGSLVPDIHQVGDLPVLVGGLILGIIAATLVGAGYLRWVLPRHIVVGSQDIGTQNVSTGMAR